MIHPYLVQVAVAPISRLLGISYGSDQRFILEWENLIINFSYILALTKNEILVNLQKKLKSSKLLIYNNSKQL